MHFASLAEIRRQTDDHCRKAISALRRMCLLLVPLGLFLIAGNAIASNSRVERDNLHGVKPIYILISPIPDWVTKNGVTRQMLREWVENEFRKNKIDTSDTLQDNGGAFSIGVFGTEGIRSIPPHDVVGYQYLNIVRVQQNVRLLYDKRISLVTSWGDWKTAFYGSGAAKEAAKAFFEDIKSATDVFISDYRAANPE
jgi:hypothetical protein